MMELYKMGKGKERSVWGRLKTIDGSPHGMARRIIM
jgi:hypothetical protein